MTATGTSLLLLWGFLIFLWLFRLQRYELYVEKSWVSLWITARALFRLGIGIFGILAWESLRTPEPSSFHAIIVDTGCIEAWKLSEELAQKLLKKHYRTALLAVKGEESFWAIPPTTDSTLFFLLMKEMKQAAIPSQGALPALRSIRRQLIPYQERLTQTIWVGRFPSEVKDRLPGCIEDQRTAISIKTPSLPTWKGYGLAFLLCAFLLLLGDGSLYFFRKYLPLRSAQDLKY